ncbi:MAG TPA: hypothetical protein VM716_10830 [Gemmatimonadales bacterium]|nr:hypothetical protein [Gemmatimonadales bacterium]
MRHTIALSAAALAGLTTAASAQKPKASIQLADVAGAWVSKTMVGPKDSVVGTVLFTTTADGKGSTMTFPNHQQVAVRVVSVAGDSVVTEAGPFPSYLRPGQTVTLLHIVGHYKGDEMWGTGVAQYASGDKLIFKTKATRRK